MKTYEVWITESAGSIHVRVERVEAASDRQAFLAGQALCVGTEFVRGVVEVAP